MNSTTGPEGRAAPDLARRRRLRIAAKLMATVGLLALAFAFIASFFTGNTRQGQLPSMRVFIGNILPGGTDTFIWEGRPVIVRRRTEDELAQLLAPDARLLDAASASSDQPSWAMNTYRSRDPEWFVAVALATDLGCSVAYSPIDDQPFLNARWPGGFLESCKGSRYDLAGRVYKGQDAQRNLAVPPHAIENDTLVLGGSG